MHSPLQNKPVVESLEKICLGVEFNWKTLSYNVRTGWKIIFERNWRVGFRLQGQLILISNRISRVLRWPNWAIMNKKKVNRTFSVTKSSRRTDQTFELLALLCMLCAVIYGEITSLIFIESLFRVAVSWLVQLPC